MTLVGTDETIKEIQIYINAINQKIEALKEKDVELELDWHPDRVEFLFSRSLGKAAIVAEPEAEDMD